MTKNTLNTVYEGASKIGKISALYNLIVGVIISLVIMSVGIFLIRRPIVHTKSTNATVQKVSCRDIVSYDSRNNKNIQEKCTLDVLYNVNNKDYVSTLINQSRVPHYSKIMIKYNPENPSDISTSIHSKYIGYFSLFFAIMILISIVINFYFVKQYKPYAAVQGANTSLNITRGILNRII